ncbi:MAG: PIG-L family deacetylase [candidate division Zixibacteria bacterium]|nr:PIG-L family deacetylase [candidate division Zixibacteria bacterium]
MNVLIVAAHHDDLELGCGGTVAKLLDGGHQVISLIMTHSGYRAPDGASVRTKDAAKKEAESAARSLGYKLICSDEDTFDVPVNDSNICKILDAIHKYKIDTLFTHWHGDTHPPHRRINTMALHACRQVPRVLGFAVNWYMGEQTFSPRLFVSIDDSQWERKIGALQCYESEFRRAGPKWVEYLNHQALNYGTAIGVKRAEGFTVYKHLWEV